MYVMLLLLLRIFIIINRYLLLLLLTDIYVLYMPVMQLCVRSQ